MLTATYSFVALAAEQDSARGLLSRLHQYVQNAWHGLHGFDALEAALQKLMQFDKFCRQRKFELYVIPALRRLSGEAGRLLSELETLSARASELLRSVQALLAPRLERGASGLREGWHRLNQYCEVTRGLLEREERELLPLARRDLSVEDWFAIASQFLSTEREGGADGRRRAAARQSHAHLSNLNLN